MKLAARIVGVLQVYNGTTGNGSGFLDDFDGRWVYLTLDSFRTIGSASSGAAIAAAWTQTLYSHIWANYDNTACPILTSGGSGTTRGASASADFSANKRLTVPDYRGRVILGAGTGGGSLTARAKGTQGGAETHTLQTTEIPAHTHLQTGYGNTGGGVVAAGADYAAAPSNTASTGGGGGHNNMQPWQAEHLLISSGARV